MAHATLTNESIVPRAGASPRAAPTLGLPTVDFQGVRIQAATLTDAMSVVDQTVLKRERLLIGVVNAAKLVTMREDQALREAVTKANLILADGMAVVWACRLLGRRLPERVTGIDLMDQMLLWGQRRHYRIFFLGASDDVLLATLTRIRRQFPGVIIAGGRNGFFTSDQEPAVVAAIRAARPDILLAAMSSPKKELFLARWFDKLEVPVCHGVGGAFDVFAGKVRRAPKLWQKLGLEWLYRVLQEPRRLWKRYLVTNTVFAGLVLREMFRGVPAIDSHADASSESTREQSTSPHPARNSVDVRNSDPRRSQSEQRELIRK
ncbi:MAG: WecB/TagA/CpsF family glycosyltransferase [Planctomycetota bacterium]